MTRKYFKTVTDHGEGIVDVSFITEKELRDLANYYLENSDYDWDMNFHDSPLGTVIEFVERVDTVTEIDEETYKANTVEESRVKKFSIAVFLDEKEKEDDGDELHQRMYEYIEEYAPSYTARDVARELEKAKFITYPHVTGTGVTLLNMKHVTEISIMEETEEEA